MRVAAKAHGAAKSAPAAKAAATRVVVPARAVAGKPPVAAKGAAVTKAGAPSGKNAPKSGAAARSAVLAAAIERRAIVPEDRQSQLKLLIARGKEQGYLTYAQVNDHLPSEIVDPEQIEDIVNTINDMGIPVYEKAPDSQSLLASDPASPADEEAIEEAAAALAALDAELGRTTDPKASMPCAWRSPATPPRTNSCCTPMSSSRLARSAWSIWSWASSTRTRRT